jgi:phosphoenolpyruvate carboxykinase (ATP)
MVRAALSGALDDAPTRVHEHFRLNYVTDVPGVDPAILDPRTSWTDEAAYEAAAAKLVKMFATNFERFAAHVPTEVLAAGPR